MDIDRAVRNLRINYAKVKAVRDAKKVQVIEYIKPNKATAQSLSKRGKKQMAPDVICQAVTLSGKKCKFRASNGCFCRKHS